MDNITITAVIKQWARGKTTISRRNIISKFSGRSRPCDREPPRRRRCRRRRGGEGGGGGYRFVSVRARSAAAVRVCARRPSPRSGAPDVTSAPGIGRRRDRGALRPASGGPDVRRVSSSRVYASRATITCLTIEFYNAEPPINTRPLVFFNNNISKILYNIIIITAIVVYILFYIFINFFILY